MCETKVEYLISIETKNSFCNSIETFDNLLQTNSDIKIKDKSIIYKNYTFQYENQTQELNDDFFRYFHISIIYISDTSMEQYIDVFDELLRQMRLILGKFNAQIEILWNDINLYYAEKSYPVIYIVENLMRKLITKFMLINVGINWDKSTLPSKISNQKSRNTNKANQQGYLYNLDFIDLANFLFDDYQAKSIYEMKNLIQRKELLKREELEQFIPCSNWQKYFKNFVSCEDKELKSKWEKLYELRCKVAHNNLITRTDYDDICTISKSIRKPIEEAINKLDSVQVDTESKELLAETIAMNRTELIGQFILKYRELENMLFKINGNKKFTTRESILDLKNNLIITEEIYKKFIGINNLRNKIVHQGDSINEQIEQSILTAINQIEEILIVLLNLIVKRGNHNEND